MTGCESPGCQPSTCEPPACEPVGCDAGIVIYERPRPVRDMFLKLRAMFACNVCCCSPCCCEPVTCAPAVCEPACGPVACEPACGPVCGPVVCDPYGPKPLMGLFQNLFAGLNCGPVYGEPICGEPARCGCGNCGGDQSVPAEPDADATDPAPTPPEAPVTPPTAQWQKAAEKVRSTGYYDFRR